MHVTAFLHVCICMCVFVLGVYTHTYMPLPSEPAKGARPPGAGVAGSRELPALGVGTSAKSSMCF